PAALERLVSRAPERGGNLSLHLKVGAHLPNMIYADLRNLLHAHTEVIKHYGWAQRVLNGRIPKNGWKWPNMGAWKWRKAPVLPTELLDTMTAAIDQLERDVSEWAQGSKGGATSAPLLRPGTLESCIVNLVLYLARDGKTTSAAWLAKTLDRAEGT